MKQKRQITRIFIDWLSVAYGQTVAHIVPFNSNLQQQQQYNRSAVAAVSRLLNTYYDDAHICADARIQKKNTHTQIS